MNFALTAEQEALRAAAREMFAAEVPAALLREAMASDDVDPERLWGHLSELGFLGLALPEAVGGQGLGLVELTVVLEEAGRVLMPGPFLSTVTAADALNQSANAPIREQWLPRIARGEAKASLCIAEPAARWDAEGIQTRVTSSGTDLIMDGVKLFCPDAGVADLLLVAARREGAGNDPDRVGLYAVEPGARGVQRRRLGGLDLTRSLHEVRLEGVRISPAAEIGRGWGFLQRVMDRANVALCGEMVGSQQRVLELSTEYAKTREQFGRPIGIYQAISHRIADMLVGVENSRSLTYYAAWAQDAGGEDASVAASMAKAYTAESFRTVAEAGIQVHGGIGFTWEHDLHLFLRRAKASEVALGDPRHHRELVAQAMDL